MARIRIAIFASGKGTNANNLINHFKDNDLYEIAFLLCNKQDAPVVKIAEDNSVEVLTFDNAQVENGDFLLDICTNQGIDAILLAGYLRKIPESIIAHYPKRILNVHPALLPKFGGAGMYGKHIHKAVLDNNEEESGVTIHFVDEHYDSGDKIAQFFFKIDKEETVESLANKISDIEKRYYPIVAEETLKKLYHD